MVEVDVSDSVGTITLNRPEARNALSGEVTELLDRPSSISTPDVGAIILTGADPAFCAGFDLRGALHRAPLGAAAAQRSLAALGLCPSTRRRSSGPSTGPP